MNKQLNQSALDPMGRLLSLPPKLQNLIFSNEKITLEQAENFHPATTAPSTEQAESVPSTNNMCVLLPKRAQALSDEQIATMPNPEYLNYLFVSDDGMLALDEKLITLDEAASLQSLEDLKACVIARVDQLYQRLSATTSIKQKLKFINWGYEKQRTLSMQLFEHARAGCLSKVSELINLGAQVYYRSEYHEKYCALSIAAKYGHLRVCQFLVKNGADIKKMKGDDILDIAKGGHLPIFKWLVDNQVDLEKIKDQCLFNAAKNGHFDLCDFLLQLKADVNFVGKGDWISNMDSGPSMTPLDAAAQNGHYLVCELLIQHGSLIQPKMQSMHFNFFGAVGEITHCETSALILAAEHGHDATIELLFNNNAKMIINTLDRMHNTALYYAAKNGHTSTCKLLLRHGAKIGNYDLIAAAGNGHDLTCEVFLEANADVNKWSNCLNAIHEAGKNGHDSTCRLLISYGATCDTALTAKSYSLKATTSAWMRLLRLYHSRKDTRPLLYRAAIEGDMTACKFLIFQLGYDVNAKNGEGISPLLMAAKDGNEAAMNTLIRASRSSNITGLCCFFKLKESNPCAYLLYTKASFLLRPWLLSDTHETLEAKQELRKKCGNF